MNNIKIALVICIFLVYPTAVFAADFDNDGLSDADETFYYTDSFNPDTDGDGYLDGAEIVRDFSPHKGNGATLSQNDYDKDGLNDWLERWFKSDIGAADTDGDGVNDYEEVLLGYSPKYINNGTKFKKKIEVDLTNQRVYFFVDGVKILNLAASTGNPDKASITPGGEFKILKKIENKRYVGPTWDLSNVLWNMQFKAPLYYIHGAYWHNDFGIKTHSHGCVNLSNTDAKFLYKYVDVGTAVFVTGKTPSKYYVGT